MTTPAELENCSGCLAAPGEPHGEDCDHARCPDCGEQLIFHDCEHWTDDGLDRPAMWHGIDPRAEVAQALNWWKAVTGFDHLVEDYTRVLFAEALDQIAWDPQAQRYTIGQIDNAALDHALANSNP